MKQDKETIKSYFQTGDKPKQQEYYDTWDSFWHKDELGVAGNNQELQFNTEGSFGADPSLKFDADNKKLIATSSEFLGGTKTSVINTDRDLTYVKNPIGGQYSLTTGTETGYLVIKSPHTVGNDYVHYNFTLEIGSQYHSPMQMHISAQWLTTGFSRLHAYSISQQTKNYTIRAGSDGTNIYFLIGEADTVWNRSYVKLKDISITYVYKDIDVFKTGWEIDFSSGITDFISSKTQENVDIFSQIVGVKKITENLQENSWNTIAIGSPISFSGIFLLKRYDQIEGCFTVSRSYGNRTLTVNYLTQLSAESIKGVRLTLDHKVQILLGNKYNTGIDIKLVNSSGEFQLVNEVATGNENVVRSIDLDGNEFGEIHSNPIEALGGVVLRSDDGTRWNISIDNTGTLITTSA